MDILENNTACLQTEKKNGPWKVGTMDSRFVGEKSQWRREEPRWGKRVARENERQKVGGGVVKT